jgi:hypothetical protein
MIIVDGRRCGVNLYLFFYNTYEFKIYINSIFIDVHYFHNY